MRLLKRTVARRSAFFHPAVAGPPDRIGSSAVDRVPGQNDAGSLSSFRGWARVALGVTAALSIAAPMRSFADCTGRCAGWEAVEEYNGTNPDLPKTVVEAVKFEQAIDDHSATWITDFSWSDDNAWERDFKESAQSGTDKLWVDDVDLVLFAGHGNSSGIFFGVNQGDLQAHWNESTLGDKDLEWLILDACQVLKNDASKWNRWGWPVFEGLHYILGYSTNTFDKDSRGEDFIKYAMQYGWRVKSAWIKATILSESGTTAAYMRADSATSNTYEDHLWGFGFTSSDPDNPDTLYYLSWSTD